MKKQFTFAVQLIVAVSIFMSMKANGQFAGTGTYMENPFGANPVQARYVSNDIIEFSGDTFRVATWEPGGTGDGFGWDVDFSSNNYTGLLQLTGTSSVFHPDVCFVAAGKLILGLQ